MDTAQECSLIGKLTVQRRYWSGAVATVLLHVAIVAVLLSLRFGDNIFVQSVHEPEHETILTLPPAAVPAKPVPGRSGPTSIITMPVPSFRNPNPSAEALALGTILYGCSLENRGQLTAKELSRCDRIATVDLSRLRDGLPKTVRLPGPAWEGLRNSDLRARERNTSDPCMAAKATGTECIHEILYGKGLW